MCFRNRFFINLRKIFRIMGLVGILFYAGNLSGQNYFTENFTIDAGLPSNTVRAIFKDSRGIMWIGTGAGLCRFNGREFTIYNSSNGLAAENIFDITEDSNGNLWIGAMGGGISTFDGKKFTNYSLKDGLVCNEVRRVWWSRRFNVLLVGTNKGCSVFDGKQFYSLPASEIHSNTDTWFVLGFLEREDFIELYAYGFERVFRYYPSTHGFLEDPSGVNDFTGPSCSPLILKNGDTILGWGRSGIKVWNNGLKKAFDSLGQVFHMVTDDENNIWIAAWAEAPSGPKMPGGFYKYDGTNVIRLSEKTGITDPRVWTVLYDSVFHVVWVGTLHQGLFRMPYPCFEWYDPSYFGLTSMKINDIFSDKQNNLWIATSRQIIRMKENGEYYIYTNREIKSAQLEAAVKYHPLLATHQIDRYGSYEKYEKLIAEGKFPFPNPYHYIISDLGSEMKVPAGSLYDPVTYAKNALNLKKQNADTSSVCFFAIGEDSHENIYVSGGFGLNRFKEGSNLRNPEVIPVKGNIWVFAFDESDTLFVSSYWDKGIWHCAIFPELMYPKRHYYSATRDNAPANPVRMISRGNEIWCASRSGGLYLTRDGRNFSFCTTDTTLPRSINDICFDGPQNIIAGANNGEVLILRLEGEQLKLLCRLNSKDGIVGKSIQWVQTDHQRNLYVGSNTGLNVIDLNDLFATGKARVRFFSRQTGFCSLNGKRAVVDRSGDLWIATDKNLCRIRHDLMQKDPVHKTRLILTGLEINHVPLIHRNEDSLDRWFGFPLKSIRLSHQQNNLVFSFDVLNYLNADQQLFRHRLFPAIEDWSDFSTDRKAVFTTLRPDTYTLEIEAMNLLDQGLVSELSYTFTIRPPYYYTWWFITLSLILLTGIVVLVFLLRATQIRKEEKKKADIRLELNNIEMKALKAQMNPHFIFNAINSIQSFILSNNVDKALYYLSMFAKLVRKTLENTSKDLIPLHEELTYLNFYIELEKMRFEGEFTTKTEIDPDLPLETTMIPPMIIQPFVENAIKHGLLKLETKGHLTLQVRKLNEFQFQFIIEDNGIGRQKANELKKKEGKGHHSKGMEITNTRIRLLNENGRSGKFRIVTIDLTDTNGNPAGTRVEVTLPLEG